MRTPRPAKPFPILWLFLSSFLACGPAHEEYTLSVEEGKIFRGVHIEKIWEKELYGRLVLALPQGVFCDEIQDVMGGEHKFQLFDYAGRLVREKSLLSGQGPDEVTVVTKDNTWLSSTGQIMVEDDDYLKTIDPASFEVRTLAKFANMIRGFGGKFIFGRHTGTTFEEKGNRTVTTFESTGYYENLTYYIGVYRNLLEDFSIIQKVKMPKPVTRMKLEERKRESYTDYYHLLRIHRIFTVDWTRDVVYFVPNIEKPEIGFVNIGTGAGGRYLVEANPGTFSVDRKELEFYHEYVRDQTDPRLKSYYKDILYVPPNAPALMAVKVVGDRLIIITGKRDWAKQENEALVYRLPSLEYEGSFPIPYPNLVTTRWYDDFYITEKLVKRNDDFFYYWEIYNIRFD
ncbi:MAG: hypothetical protein OEW05_00300 [Candidatus Aminicenantes bacterium]|nr:hypothetical protein [Candidatus Aminicenantes bacterium]